MKTSILWFRRDLRLFDNKALDWVCENSEAVIPIYIYSAEEESPWVPGAASRWWLHQSLFALQKKLAEYNLELQFFTGFSSDVITKIKEDSGATSLVFNRLYEPHLYERDNQIEEQFKDKLEVVAFDSGLFLPPGTVLNNQQLPYRVFTPFYKKFRPLIEPNYSATTDPVVGLKALKSVTVSNKQTLASLELLEKNNWYQKLHQHWQPGEDKAHEVLENFVDDAVDHYDIERDLPAVDSTSQLSPHLHFGEITPQQICLTLWPLIESSRGEKAKSSAEVFLKQLVWREFAHNVLWHFPETSASPMNKRYQKKFWRGSDNDLKVWQRGETGIALVDAGMKQLWQTGWMHNRVRMVASSFLAKNLGVNWLDGAKWFWDTLVDADLANNSMGWQWVAGCGVDAAPYYRVFNPDTQAKRFDKKNQYINRWSPPSSQSDYPPPMVDLSASREDAMIRYNKYIRTTGE